MKKEAFAVSGLPFADSTEPTGPSIYNSYPTGGYFSFQPSIKISPEFININYFQRVMRKVRPGCVQ
jgi:hypothetical protein